MSRVRPILFNTDMVQATLADRKTATRCTVKPQPERLSNWIRDGRIPKNEDGTYNVVMPNGRHTTIEPKYKPGDILYVRETWAFMCCLDCDNCKFDLVPGDDEVCAIHKTPTIHEDIATSTEGCYIYRADYPRPDRIVWRPSIHMPKAAARIWLEVTDVKIQRLQEMRLDDFLNEGVRILPEILDKPNNAYTAASYKFMCIWNPTIQPQDKDKYRWQANPWVWVYDFKRCEKPMEVTTE